MSHLLFFNNTCDRLSMKELKLDICKDIASNSATEISGISGLFANIFLYRRLLSVKPMYL